MVQSPAAVYADLTVPGKTGVPAGLEKLADQISEMHNRSRTHLALAKTVRSRDQSRRQTLDASSQSRRSVDCIIARSGVLAERRCYSDHLPLSADFNGVPARPRSCVEPYRWRPVLTLIGFPLDFVAAAIADSNLRERPTVDMAWLQMLRSGNLEVYHTLAAWLTLNEGICYSRRLTTVVPAASTERTGCRGKYQRHRHRPQQCYGTERHGPTEE